MVKVVTRKLKRIYIPANKPEDWKPLLAQPDKHWKSGYSAKSLAYCWQEANGFPKEIREVFKKSEYKIFHNINLLFAFPEYQVFLDTENNPSQNDIFVLAKSDNQLFSIAIEGKVSERFGDKVKNWLLDNKSGENKEARLSFLCKALLINKEDILNIGYQLLHRTVSGILEAKKFNAQNAMMIVHSFSPTNEHFGDYSEWLKVFNIRNAETNRIYLAKEISNISLYFCWVQGDRV